MLGSLITVRIQASMLILLFVTLAGVTAVRINDLKVPAVIRNGTEEFVILDCDYSLEEDEKPGLVVKWFFTQNNKQSPVYQWIPKQKPHALGILRGKLNLDYKADEDSYKMYRALQIRRPSVELSGDWVCRVSTFEGDAYEAARMIVFAPEKDMGMKVTETNRGGFVNISFWAIGTFPEPRLTLYHGENKDQKVEDMAVETRLRHGAYDIRAYKVIQDANLSSVPSIFDCELTIPNTEYVKRKSTLYQPGSLALKDDSANTASWSRLTTTGPLILLTQLLLALKLMMASSQVFS